MVLDEERRRNITDAIANVLECDHPAIAKWVRRSSRLDARPYLPVQMGYSNTLKLWYVQVTANTVGLAESRLALYDHQEKVVILPTAGLRDLVINTVRRTGFEVEGHRLVKATAFERKGWADELNFDPKSWFTGPPPTRNRAGDKCANGLSPSQTGGPGPGKTPRDFHLTASAIAKVPEPVAQLLALGRGQHQSDSGWTPAPGSQMWTAPQCAGLVESLGDLELPASAEAVWEGWHQVSPYHAHLLTARELSRTETAWWDALPTYAVTRTPVTGTGVVPPAGYVNKPLPVDLRAMDDEYVDESLREPPGEVRALGLRQRDPARVVVPAKRDSAAGAVVVTAILRDFGAPPPPIKEVCRLCSCTYSVEDLTCSIIEQVGTVDYCPGCCADTKGTVDQFAYDSSEVQLLDQGVTTALTALRDRLQTLPTRRALRDKLLTKMAPLERDEWMLLQMALPLPVPFSVPMGEQRPQAFTDWLRIAGLIDGCRTGRGVASTAADGHAARSIFEREVDDWMHVNGVAHEE